MKVTTQYRNMVEGLVKELRALVFAEQALRRAGIKQRRAIVRGGTDGSRLTEMGLLTPNLFCGEHNIHSPLEWTCLEGLEAAVCVLVEVDPIVWTKNMRSFATLGPAFVTVTFPPSGPQPFALARRPGMR